MRLLLPLLLTTLLAPSALAGEAQVIEDPRVDVDLLARATRDGVRVGIRHRIEAGWHIYWENPGDSGMATAVEVEAPGWTAGPLLYPGPTLFSSGGLTSYGYAGEVVFFVDLKGEDRADLMVRSRWLICKEICLPQSAIASMPLPRAPDASTLLPLEALLPRQARPEDGVSIERTGDAFVIKVAGESPSTLFPSVELEEALGGKRPSFLREEIVNSGAFQVLRGHLSNSSAKGPLRGVLRLERTDGPVFIDLALPSPETGSSP